MKSKLYGHEFSNGTLCISRHFLKISGRSVGPCTAKESKLKPAAAKY